MSRFKQYMDIINEMMLNKDTDFESQKEMLKQGYLKSGKIKTIDSEKRLLGKMILRINSLDMFKKSEGFESSDLKNDENYLYFKDEKNEFIVAKFFLTINTFIRGDFDDTDNEYYLFYYDIKNKFIYGQERDQDDAFSELEKNNIEYIKANKEKIKNLEAVYVINNRRIY